MEISVSVLALKHSTQLSHTANIESGIRRCVSVSLEKQSILYVMTERVNHYEKTGMIFTGTSYMCYKWKLFLAEVSLLNQMWPHIITLAILKQQPWRACIYTGFVFSAESLNSSPAGSNITSSADKCIISILGYLNHWHKGSFMQLFGKIWEDKKSLEQKEKITISLSACWSTKCQTIHIHLFGRPQQRGRAPRDVQPEMADISAFKRLTAAYKQHTNF